MEVSSIGFYAGDKQYVRMEESPELAPYEPKLVARRLRALRMALGLSRSEFADLIRVDRSSYTKIENGEKPLLPYAAYRIYELYTVDMNYIYLGKLGGVPLDLSKKVMNHLANENA